MPYSNIIPATPASLLSITKYLVNSGHRDHLEYDLTPLVFYGAKTVEEFIATALENLAANKKPFGRLRVGPQPKYAANWIIVRTPDCTQLSDEEWHSYRDVILDEAGQGCPVVGIANLHKNRLTGAADINVLAAKFDRDGSLLRDRSRHPVKALRARIDETTRDLNLQRKSVGLPAIQTMQQVQRKSREQRGEIDLVTQLATMAKPPLKLVDLKSALRSLGFEITRFSPSKNYVSVIKPGKKKKRAKKFIITRLLADVAAWLRRTKNFNDDERDHE